MAGTRGARRGAGAAVLVVLAAALTGCATKTNTNHTFFEFTGSELTIRTDSDLSVVPAGEGEPLDVKQTLKGTGSSKPDPVTTLKDGVLSLLTRCPHGTGTIELPCDGKYVVALPPHVKLVVRSDQQPVLVDRIRTDIDVRTENQPIIVRNTGPGTTLRMNSSNGWLQGLKLRSADVTAVTTNKVVTLNFVDPPDRVRARVSNDRATVTVPRGGPRYRVVTHLDSTGKRCVEAPVDPSSDHVVDLTTTRGNARVFVSSVERAAPPWPAGSVNEDMPGGCLNPAEKTLRGIK